MGLESGITRHPTHLTQGFSAGKNIKNMNRIDKYCRKKIFHHIREESPLKAHIYRRPGKTLALLAAIPSFYFTGAEVALAKTGWPAVALFGAAFTIIGFYIKEFCEFKSIQRKCRFIEFHKKKIEELIRKRRANKFLDE